MKGSNMVLLRSVVPGNIGGHDVRSTTGKLNVTIGGPDIIESNISSGAGAKPNS